LALASGKTEDVAAAAAQFKALVDRRPSNSVWRYAYGRALAAEGDFEAAQIQQHEAIKGQPGFLQPHLALAELFQAKGDYRAALDQANRSLAIDPNSPSARLLHAISLMHTGGRMVAGRELVGLEKDHPHDPKVQVQLALLDLREKRPTPAENRLRKLVAEHPEDVSAQSALQCLREHR